MQKHKEDILSLSSYQNSLIATSSYDGDIYIWSLETAHPLCRLNANESIKPRTGSHTISRGIDEVESLERRDSADKLTRKTGSAGSHQSFGSADGGTCEDNATTHKSHHSVAPTTAGSKAGSRTMLPALTRHRSVLDRRNSQNFEEERAAAGSRTFFTESLNGGSLRNGQEDEDVNNNKEEVVEEEKEEVKEMFDKRHESAVDKVCLSDFCLWHFIQRPWLVQVLCCLVSDGYCPVIFYFLLLSQVRGKECSMY